MPGAKKDIGQPPARISSTLSTMSAAFSLSEFTELVSTALEIDNSLDSKLTTFDSFSPSSSSYSSSENAKPSPSLPSTSISKSSPGSPRVLRKIKSLLAYGSGRFNQSPPPPLPSSASKSTRSEPLMTTSEPSSPLKPIPAVSLLDQKAQVKSEIALFVPYLPLADRHERFGTSASIFSRRGSDCGSSIVPPENTSDSGDSEFSESLLTPPQSPRTHRRASSSSSVSCLQSAASSAFHGDLISVSNSLITQSRYSSMSSHSTNSSRRTPTEQSSESSMHSHSLDASDMDPFAKGRVQVVARRTSAGSSHGSSSIFSSNSIHPFSSSHPAQSIVAVKEWSANDKSAAEYGHFLTSTPPVSRSKSSERRKRVSPTGRPKQKPVPTCPLPLPPKSKPPTRPLPSVPIDNSYSDDSSSSLPSPPITPPGSFRGSSGLSKQESEKDWTLGLPYTSDEDLVDSRRIFRHTGLSRSNEVLPRRRSNRPSRNEDSAGLPLSVPLSQVLPVSLAQRRTDLKPMGHKRKGSPFPLILSPSIPSPDSIFAGVDHLSATAATSRVLCSHYSLLSSDSDSSDSLENAHRRLEKMMREPAGMILGEKGIPVPLSVASLPNILPVNTNVPMQRDLGLDEDIETPMQSPITPMSGQFAYAQNLACSDRSLSLNPQPKRNRSEQGPKSVVMLSLDPFAISDSESLTSGEETSYWSARSSMDSVIDSTEEPDYVSAY
ncbi:MAG: hypothetical protein NXY57DRAFT_730651 [Lentinula lateritia]|nr:MAG: hypothetical protein NXY57DRAFT_730651 [Lentinula lateritia]